MYTGADGKRERTRIEKSEEGEARGGDKESNDKGKRQLAQEYQYLNPKDYVRTNKLIHLRSRMQHP